MYQMEWSQQGRSSYQTDHAPRWERGQGREKYNMLVTGSKSAHRIVGSKTLAIEREGMQFNFEPPIQSELKIASFINSSLCHQYKGTCETLSSLTFSL